MNTDGESIYWVAALRDDDNRDAKYIEKEHQEAELGEKSPHSGEKYGGDASQGELERGT